MARWDREFSGKKGMPVLERDIGKDYFPYEAGAAAEDTARG